jgi:hypothetical protein
MDLAIWISIVGVLATLAVGLPVYWLKQGDRAPRGAGRELTVNQHVRVSQRYSQQTHNHYSSGSGHAQDEDLWGYLGLVLAAAATYWAWRPYLLVALGALVAGCAVLTWAGQRWVRPGGGRTQTLLLLLAFGGVGANCLLLVYPGLVWGDGLRLSWTFAEGLHRHGLGFALGAVPLLAATVLSLLLLTTRCLAILAARFADRSRSATRAAAWGRIAQHVGPIGLSQRVLRASPLLALAGLVWILAVPLIGHPTFYPLQVPAQPPAPHQVR